MSESSPQFSAESAADAAAELLAAAAALETPSEPPSDTAASDPLSSLPKRAQGLMRIDVPVAVLLATQRKSVQEITEISPGAIIKFEKTCDEPLELCIGGRPIATGEVVKVGDKFGLRIGRLVRGG